MNELPSRTLTHTEHYLDGLNERPVAAPIDLEWMRERFDGPLPARPVDPRTVINDLVAAAEPSLVATAGPRYLGFVTGGTGKNAPYMVGGGAQARENYRLVPESSRRARRPYVSVSGWNTTDDDVERAIRAIRHAAA